MRNEKENFKLSPGLQEHAGGHGIGEKIVVVYHWHVCRSDNLASKPSSVQGVDCCHRRRHTWTLHVNVACRRHFVNKNMQDPSVLVALLDDIIPHLQVPAGSVGLLKKKETRRTLDDNSSSTHLAKNGLVYGLPCLITSLKLKQAFRVAKTCCVLFVEVECQKNLCPHVSQ